MLKKVLLIFSFLTLLTMVSVEKACNDSIPCEFGHMECVDQVNSGDVRMGRCRCIEPFEIDLQTGLCVDVERKHSKLAVLRFVMFGVAVVVGLGLAIYGVVWRLSRRQRQTSDVNQLQEV